MALTTRVNGSTVGGNPNNITATWFNDFNNLFTGAMTDQPVTFNYRPGSGTTPTFTLKGDGSGPLLRAFDTNNTTVVATLDHSGNLTLSGNLSAGGTFGVTGNATLSGTLAVTGNTTLSGTLAVTGNATIRGGKNVLYTDTTGLTGKMTAANTAPSSPATGDLWLDTSVVLG